MSNHATVYAKWEVLEYLLKLNYNYTGKNYFTNSDFLTLDTTLPRYYSRGFHIQGTKGMYEEENQSIFIDEKDNHADFKWSDHWGNVKESRDEYEHPIWKQFLEDGVRGGHGGMDYLVFRAFFESVADGTNPPIDVYDMATWMAITPLSEKSIKLGTSVEIPDFTNGKWVLE